MGLDERMNERKLNENSSKISLEESRKLFRKRSNFSERSRLEYSLIFSLRNGHKMWPRPKKRQQTETGTNETDAELREPKKRSKLMGLY